MNDILHPHHSMLEATRLTRAGQLTEATELLQRLLRGDAPPDRHRRSYYRIDPPDGSRHRRRGVLRSRRRFVPRLLRHELERRPRAGLSKRSYGRRPYSPKCCAASSSGQMDRSGRDSPDWGGHFRCQRPTPCRTADSLLRGLTAAKPETVLTKFTFPAAIRRGAPPGRHAARLHPDAQRLRRRHAHEAIAEERTCLVAYPAQPAAANPRSAGIGFARRPAAWPWRTFADCRHHRSNHARLPGGPPTRLCRRPLGRSGRGRYHGDDYPDLYAAMGVHSGLACGVASDLPSAFAAMRQGEPPASSEGPAT